MYEHYSFPSYAKLEDTMLTSTRSSTAAVISGKSGKPLPGQNYEADTTNSVQRYINQAAHQDGAVLVGLRDSQSGLGNSSEERNKALLRDFENAFNTDSHN